MLTIISTVDIGQTAYALISRGSVTDTKLQVGQSAIPTTSEEEVPEADRYLHEWKEDLLEGRPKEHLRSFSFPFHAWFARALFCYCHALPLLRALKWFRSLMRIMVMRIPINMRGY